MGRTRSNGCCYCAGQLCCPDWSCRADASFERRKWEGNGGSSMPFVFSVTWRAHGINDPDSLTAFHPSKALRWGWVCELSLCRSRMGLGCGNGAVERRELLSLGPSDQTAASSAAVCAAQRPFRSCCWRGRQKPCASSFGIRGIVIGWDGNCTASSHFHPVSCA